MGLLLARNAVTSVGEAYQAAAAEGDAELAAADQAGLYQQSGDVDAARTAYERAIATGHPQYSPAASFEVAVMLDRLGQEQEARSVYRRILASGHPVKGGTAAIDLGNSLAASGGCAGAEEGFQHAANGAWQDAADLATEARERLRSMPRSDQAEHFPGQMSPRSRGIE
ncbi:tetratricopeptide repeat protein [Streptomyces sp. BBFR25]|uniref:tetratricopeptide repeat protein n=1 Tax=Streptomyces sp. BBFR25 TaxID=3372855 RepID=UPI0037DC0F95